ncbi:hypothetical protein FSP39_000101 [Pinctada imbricata]|uniref:Uncharacterized protein n=1 Tax=Pinctada imbricata TaxID=66713 RepID=A0AA88XT17_PINIB|nr:hypothetical protein FSP39_000101 [Pinctada imbricata]
MSGLDSSELQDLVGESNNTDSDKTNDVGEKETEQTELSSPPLSSPEITSLRKKKDHEKYKRQKQYDYSTTGSLHRKKPKPLPYNDKRRNSAPVMGYQKPEEVLERKCSHATISENAKTERLYTFLFFALVLEEKESDKAIQMISDEMYVDEGSRMALTFDKADVNYIRSNDVDEARKREYNKRLLRDNLSASMSGLYGIFLAVLGTVLPITETFAGEPNPYMFELYYVYLYTVSLAFIVYVNVCVLQWRPIKSKFLSRLFCGIRQIASRVFDRIRKCRRTEWNETTEETRQEDEENTRLKDDEEESVRVVHTSARRHTGSFPLRLGAVGFGIASMIHSGLYFGQYFQTRDGSSICHNSVHAIKPFMHLLFTFVQLYFIFMNSKISIQYRRIVARFGLMHLCCTNVCVWVRCIVVETLHAISVEQSYKSRGAPGNAHIRITSSTSTGATVVTTIGETKMEIKPVEVIYPRRNGYPWNGTMYIPEISCYWTELFGKVVDEAAPYLYPCKIEYSLICAGILIVMWRNVGFDKSSALNDTTSMSSAEPQDKVYKRHKSVSCKSSSRGLFAGILVTVGAIITMIAFYVLRSKTKMDSTAIVLVHLSEAGMYILTTFAIVLAADRMKNLKFHVNIKGGIEEPLTLISFSGLFMFAVFSVVAATFEIHTPSGVLNILTNLFMIVQSTIQTLFIIAGSKVSAVTVEQERKKRGREFVAFLILCNFSMWAMNTFETQKPEHNPVQMDFYGPLPWSIFTHITVPLGIYFRFHSAVCLTNIWKNAWKPHPNSIERRESEKEEV